jgi:hypothetical protein
MRQSGLSLLELTFGCVALSLGHFDDALALARILALAAAIGRSAGALSLAGIATYALSLRVGSFATTTVSARIDGNGCCHKEGSRSRCQNRAFRSSFAVHTKSS